MGIHAHNPYHTYYYTLLYFGRDTQHHDLLNCILFVSYYKTNCYSCFLHFKETLYDLGQSLVFLTFIPMTAYTTSLSPLHDLSLCSVFVLPEQWLSLMMIQSSSNLIFLFLNFSWPLNLNYCDDFVTPTNSNYDMESGFPIELACLDVWLVAVWSRKRHVTATEWWLFWQPADVDQAGTIFSGNSRLHYCLHQYHHPFTFVY